MWLPGSPKAVSQPLLPWEEAPDLGFSLLNPQSVNNRVWLKDRVSSTRERRNANQPRGRGWGRGSCPSDTHTHGVG